MRQDPLDNLKEEGIEESLISGIETFRQTYSLEEKWQKRVPQPDYFYYGKDIWRKALAAILEGRIYC